MKKSLPIITLSAVLFLSGCFADPKLDFKDASYADITSPEQRITLTDKTDVEKLTDIFSELTYERTAEPEGGYVYDAYFTIVWYNSDGAAIEAIDIADENGYLIAHDAVVYRVDADLSADVEFIESLFTE